MSIREYYDTHGVLGYYTKYSSQYDNPHRGYIVNLLDELDCTNFKVGLDFACGDGLISKLLPDIDWIGVDPYMGDRYEAETGKHCIRANMEHVASGMVDIPEVHVIVCSYCIDLFEVSYLEMLLWRFSVRSDTLVVIRPNNKEIKSQWWVLDKFVVVGKSRMSVYKRRIHI